jgi:hypothetical protein
MGDVEASGIDCDLARAIRAFLSWKFRLEQKVLSVCSSNPGS